MKNLLNFNTFCKLNGVRLSLAPFLILFNLLPIQLLSQQSFNYFNKRIDLTGSCDKGLSVLNIENGYSVGTITQDTIYHYYWQVAFALTDTLGELYQIKQYGDSGDFYLLGNPGSLIKYRNSKYFAVGNIFTPLGDWVYNRGLIMCLDNKFDTLWTKEYGEKTSPFNDTTFGILQLKKEYNNRLIMTGVRLPKNDPSSVWLMETDSLGNKLWERFYGEGEEYFQGHSVVQTNDGGFVIGAAKFEIHATGGYLDPLIIKTDSLGNEEWRVNPGNPDVDDNKVMVALAQDGNIIAGTNYGTDQSGDNRWAVVKIMKIKPDGTVLWDKNYLEPQYDNFLLNTIVLSNGNILVNGGRDTHYLGEEYPAQMGWILCTDSMGTQLWYREYALLTGHNSFNDLYDVRETSDGGLIGVGKVSPSVPDTGTADIWVMKMDSTGCLYAGCDTTVVVEETARPADGINIYPNPVTGVFTVDIGKPLQATGSVVIYNLYGGKVREVKIPKGEQVVRINASKWKSGLYVAMVSRQEKITGKKKFVVRYEK
ncbi:MAG: hypothetical protein DRJ02_03580 [Bacteroidetes bacterium]|nr:MAG: hypothetical protein DRJ02_03580 [Bacteroidota bacterium]